MNQKDDYNAIQVFGDGQATATITFNSTDNHSVTVTNTDIAEGGLTISGNSCNGNLIEIGNCNASEISITLDNADGRFDSFNFLRSTAEVLVGSNNAPINLMPSIDITESGFTVTTTLEGDLVQPDGTGIVEYGYQNLYLYKGRQVTITYDATISGVTVFYKDSENQYAIASGDSFYPPVDGFSVVVQTDSVVSDDFYVRIMLQYGSEGYISPISTDNRTYMDYQIGYFGIDRVTKTEKSIVLNGLDSLCALDTTIRGIKDFTTPGYTVNSTECVVLDSPSMSATVIGETGKIISGTQEVYTYTIAEVFDDGDLWGRLTSTDTIIVSGSNASAGDSAWICLTGYSDNDLQIYPSEWIPMLFEPSTLRVGLTDLINTDMENDNPYNFIFPQITGDEWTLLLNITVNVFRLNPNVTMRQLLAVALAVTQNNAMVSGDNVLQIGWYTDYQEPQRLYTSATTFRSEFNENEIGITGVQYTINGTQYAFGSGDYQIIIPESDCLNALATVNGYDLITYLRTHVNWAGIWEFTYTPFTLKVLPCPINRNMLTMYYGSIVDGEYTFAKKCPVTDWVWTLHGATEMQGKGEMNNSISQSNGVTSSQSSADPFLSSDSESPVQNRVVTDALSGKKDIQTAVESPTASGTDIEFIDTIAQDEQGVITPTKKTVRTATQSLDGLMSAEDKTAVDGLAIKEIESNTDLNDCTDVGIWNCYSSSVASTLTNSPITNAGFPMMVFMVGATTARMQVIFGGTAIYTRRRTTSSWGRWYTYTGA